MPALVDAPILPHFLQPPPAPKKHVRIRARHDRRVVCNGDRHRARLGVRTARRSRGGRAQVLLPLLTHTATAIEQLADELRAYWTVALAASWSRVEDFLLADVERAGKRVPFAAAASISPAYTFAGSELDVANMHYAPISVPSTTEAWLIATVFSWPHDASIVCNEAGIAWPTRAPMLPYAPRGLANLWDDGRLPGSDALASVIGPARARIMEVLVRPTSTAEIANALAMTPGGASQLALLHNAGLVERSREQRHVYYRLSRRGSQLLALFTNDGG